MNLVRPIVASLALTAVVSACGGDDVAPSADLGMEAAAADLGEPALDSGARDAGAPDRDAGERDATAPDAAAAEDAGYDAGPHDAGPLGAVASCDVPSMIDQFPGSLPPNPFGPWLEASACIQQPHDVIIVLGCPTNDDGTPSTCQTARADLAVAFSSAGYGTRFITTGGAVQNAHIEAESLRDLLLERGIAETDVIVEPLAEHTDENLYYSTILMQARAWQTAIVVSDSAGHLIYTGICDANCCVKLGRLTVLDFPLPGRMPVRAGHYVLDPFGSPITDAECAHIEPPTRALCINLAMRRACADDFML